MRRRSRSRRQARWRDQETLLAQLPAWGLRLLEQALLRAGRRAAGLRAELRALRVVVRLLEQGLAEAEELEAPEPGQEAPRSSA